MREIDTYEPGSAWRTWPHGPRVPEPRQATCGHVEGMGAGGTGHCGEPGCPNLAPLADWERDLLARPPQPTIRPAHDEAPPSRRAGLRR